MKVLSGLENHYNYKQINHRKVNCESLSTCEKGVV